jgi:superoxide reductase
MSQRLQIYKCEICGNIVEVFHEGQGEVVCCGQPMKLPLENAIEAAKERHVPVIEKTADGKNRRPGTGQICHRKMESEVLTAAQFRV